MGEWKKVRLGNCIKEVVEKTTENNQYEVLTSSKKGIYSQEEYFDKLVASKDNTGYKIIKKGQFTYRSMSDNGTFTINRLENKDIGIVSPAYPIFKTTNIDDEYLKYYFQSAEFRKAIYNLSQGSTRTALKFKDLIEIEMLLPSIEEQKEIVKILKNVDLILNNIDVKIKDINSIRKKFEIHIFTKGLKKENIKNTEIGNIAESWNVDKLSNITTYVDYRGKTPKKVDRGIRLVTAKNIKKGYIDYDISKEYIDTSEFEKVMLRGKAKLGDVLITTEAPCGNVAQVDFERIALAQRVIKYRAKEGVLINNYLKYYLLGSNFQNRLKKYSTGGTAQGIKGSVLHQMLIAYPSIEEQEQISTLMDKYEENIQLLNKKMELYKIIKKGLMQQLLTGKVKI